MSVGDHRAAEGTGTRVGPALPEGLTRIEVDGYVYYGPAQMGESLEGAWIRAEPDAECNIGWNA